MIELGEIIRANWEKQIGIPVIEGLEPGTVYLDGLGHLVVAKDQITGRTRIRKRRRILMVRGNGLPWCRKCPFNGGCDGGDNCLREASNVGN